MANMVPIASKAVKTEVIQNAWNYIHQNFHKFNEKNKLKVVLAIISKDMPTKLEGELATTVTQMGSVKIDDKPMEITVGD